MGHKFSQPGLDRNSRLHVHERRLEIRDLVGKVDTELTTWREDRWMEKSRRLENFQRGLEESLDWFQNALEDDKQEA